MSNAMMRLILFIAIIGLASGGQASNHKRSNTSQVSSVKKISKIDNALAFINEYTKNANKMKHAVGIADWVNANHLSTAKFKKELKRIIDEAYKNDPEAGIDADPIFDAQDYPDKGFVTESFDTESNYLIVRGIDMPDFRITMKVKNENGVWLVDGCGRVNIPNNKRIKG